MIDYAYGNLVKRLQDARSWSTGVTDGNRCAFVVGVALNLKPKSQKQSFRSRTLSERVLVDGVKGMPFLGKFYLKAEDLARDISQTFGSPDLTAVGRAAIGKLADRQGVIFMADCWGPNLLGVPLGNQTWDHIDLWDGEMLEIYKGKKPKEAIHKFVKAPSRFGFGMSRRRRAGDAKV